jgi:hypothetical protein
VGVGGRTAGLRRRKNERLRREKKKRELGLLKGFRPRGDFQVSKIIFFFLISNQTQI